MVWTSCASRSILLSVIGTVFIAVGFSVPFWLSFVQNSTTGVTLYTIYIGVWYILVCKNGNPNSCSSRAIAPQMGNSTDVVFMFIGKDVEAGADIGAESLGKYWHRSFKL